MKTSLAVVLGTVFLLVSGMTLAQNTKAPATSHQDHPKQTLASENTGIQMGQMDEHMKKMQALHEQLASATTPEQRQKAMDEQRKEMQACMGMMDQMHGSGTMGGMGGGMAAQKGKPVDQKMQMQMMQKRMDMMQMMMQMMMDQQGMMASTKDAK